MFLRRSWKAPQWQSTCESQECWFCTQEEQLVWRRRMEVNMTRRFRPALWAIRLGIKLIHDRCIKLCFNRISTENWLPSDTDQTSSHVVRWGIQEDRPDGSLLRKCQQHTRLELFIGRISHAVSLSCFALYEFDLYDEMFVFYSCNGSDFSSVHHQWWHTLYWNIFREQQRTNSSLPRTFVTWL